jgi:glycosyltransferase involved in cell wall biosynthesis
MAAGRPALFVGPEHCEPADTIRAAGCGFTVAPGDTEGVVAALQRLAADAALARRMGERGRSAFLASFERRICCEMWSDLIDELASSAPAGGTSATGPAGRPRVRRGRGREIVLARTAR